MIPDRLVDFAHGAVLTLVGTRDARLRPTVTWAFGARVSAATDEISAFVPDVEIDRTRMPQNTIFLRGVYHAEDRLFRSRNPISEARSPRTDNR
jgi:hypothetical protein